MLPDRPGAEREATAAAEHRDGKRLGDHATISDDGDRSRQET